MKYMGQPMRFWYWFSNFAGFMPEDQRLNFRDISVQRTPLLWKTTSGNVFSWYWYGITSRSNWVDCFKRKVLTAYVSMTKNKQTKPKTLGQTKFSGSVHEIEHWNNQFSRLLWCLIVIVSKTWKTQFYADFILILYRFYASINILILGYFSPNIRYNIEINGFLNYFDACILSTKGK